MASSSPNFLAAGRAGFRGYAPLGVAHRMRVVLGLHNGDGTPVGDRDRDALSRLGRAEPLGDRVPEQRIGHSCGWGSRLRHAVADPRDG